jgi:hypothetical protein
MGMAIWPVDIIPGASPDDPATFVISPTLQPMARPGTIYADAGDLVYWNNTSQADHLLVQVVNGGTKPMPPVTTVTPGHQTDSWRVPNNPNSPTPMTITYKCSLHSGEIGIIQVS